ncbi:hypothetical protein E8E13_009369 [Curvularia kusanoi]|uniref:Uncharacterized protein n=1 Tax=Curvularia kusanoi TaxID=90978 RepID=A0A9P4TG08_CURKU|nr:hypothetical protein E8E13_009369 [Curvularia kusanoi]
MTSEGISAMFCGCPVSIDEYHPLHSCFAQDERDGIEPAASDQPAEERQTGNSMQTVPNKAQTHTFVSRGQVHSGKDLSPSAHETALHGLLALAAPATGSSRLDESSVYVSTDTQTVSSFDFAKHGDNNSQTAASSILTQRSPHQTDMESQPVSSLRSSRRSETIGSPEIHPGASGISGNFPDLSAPLSVGVVPLQSTSTDDSIELLKFYRYNIAPWLDICEYTQPFGVALLTKLNGTPRVRACVLRLAATISRKPWTEVNPGPTNTLSSMDDDFVAGVLEAVCVMTPKLAASWLSEDGKEGRECLLENLMAQLGRSELNDSAYWLLVRLGKSRSWNSLLLMLKSEQNLVAR